MTTLTLGTNADPLRISATNNSVDFMDLLFSSNSRSLRYWMISSIDLGPNSKVSSVFAESDAFTTVYYGKGFTNFPWIMGMWGAGSMFTLSHVPFVGKSGWFMHAHSTYLQAANCNGYSSNAKVVVYDQNAIG